MKKISFVIVISLLFISNSNSQNRISVEFAGGIIAPLRSSNGLSTAVQFNYRINSSFSFYIYSGIAGWDKYKIKFYDDRIFYSGYGPKYFDSYSSNNHILIPVYLGSKINFHTNKFFTSYLNVEVGYAYLSYNSYEQMKVINSETGEIVDYRPDESTKKINKENLFGIGIGAGISHPVSKSVDLLLAFKLNSFVNEHYYGLFSTQGTYTTFTAGCNFNL